MNPLIISAAITGSVRPGTRGANHPVRFDHVVQEALAAWRAGASILHLHARLPDGMPTGELSASRSLVQQLREAGCDAVISLSAGDNGATASHAQRIAVPSAGSELVTLSAGSFNIGQRLYDNAPDFLRQLAGAMKERGTRAEIEVIDTGHLHGIEELVSQRLLQPPYLFNLVFGIPGGFPCEPELLPVMLRRLPQPNQWMVSCQTDDAEVARRFAFAAFAAGGHVRTGMEDCSWLRPGEPARSNADQVELWVKTATLWGRAVASPRQARELLGLAGPLGFASAGGEH